MNKKEKREFEEMIADEEDGYNKYMEMAALYQEDDPVLAEGFRMMAVDEQKHKTFIERIMEAL